MTREQIVWDFVIALVVGLFLIVVGAILQPLLKRLWERMVRGAPEGNEVMMAPGHETGFGLLANSAIDQHVDARGREKDLDQMG